MEAQRNVVFGILFLVSGILSVPIAHQYCPVIKDSDLEPGVPLGSKVIRMDEVDGQKVKLQFYYPSANRKRIAESSAETTTAFQQNGPDALDDLEGITSTLSNQQEDSITTTTGKGVEFDLACQWEFRAGNDSQFLLLTFEKLSAPYSDNCAEAFVAMQKDNGYESRWCGNRRQANARPMALFSRGSAKISIYRSANAPQSPSTGFTVVVQSVDVNMLEEQSGKNALRVLIG